MSQDMSLVESQRSKSSVLEALDETDDNTKQSIRSFIDTGRQILAKKYPKIELQMKF
jgi:DNA-binding MltR family transcriptional regulator